MADIYINSNAYAPGAAKRVKLEVELFLDQVPGAYHSIEDHIRTMFSNAYITKATVIEQPFRAPEPNLGQILRDAFDSGQNHDEVRNLVKDLPKLYAIKEIRARLSVTLIEAKHLYERWFESGLTN